MSTAATTIPAPTAPSHAPAELDPAVQGLIEDERKKHSRRLRGRTLSSAVVWTIGFFAVAAALVAFVPTQRSASAVTIAALIVAYALASRIEFEVRTGYAMATQIVLVPILFLAPTGLLASLAAFDNTWASAAVLPLLGLLKLFANERQVRIDHALELSHAYRGTALLLGDVVEADDAYTGSHSRDVVELVLDVSDELGLSARERRDAEFVALLHDIGKIRIPAEIINKPGPLDDEERA